MTSKTRNEILSVTIVQHIPQGLCVKWGDNQEGIVRVREISWDKKELRNWREKYPIGWHGDALLLPRKREGANKLSLRLAKRDPWKKVSQGFKEKKLYEGIVTGVVEYGAFIEIVSGLTGLLHHSQIPVWCEREPTELFWPGDKVLVKIRSINQDKRRIELELPPVQTPKNGHFAKISDMSIITRDEENNLEKLLERGASRKHILVVENEKAQSMAIAQWLRRLNQRVDIVESAEEALEFLEKVKPDIALIDIGLSGMSGTDLVDYILREYPDIQAINATDWAHANSIKETLDALQARGANLVLKPLLPEDLVPFLIEDEKIILSNEEESPQEELRLLDIPDLDAEKRIRKLLLLCKKRLSFDQVILFSLESTHRSVVIIDHIGDGLINKIALPYLIYSPVRDVAEDRDVIAVDEIDEWEKKRFRHLIEFYPSLVSCIGVPVSVQETFNYALFVFGEHTRHITSEEQFFVEGIALMVGTALTQKSLNEKNILMQRTALIGLLTRALMHEINNLMGPLWNSTNTLEEKLSQCGKDADKRHCGEIKKELSVIQQDVRQIINTTKMFGRIVKKGKSEILRVGEIISETLNLLEDISDRAHVLFSFSEPEQLIIVRSQAVVLEQIFLNVLLNAIQQIDENRPNVGGWVKIDMKLVHSEEQGPMCRILVQDNGPGIHLSLWEKIFEIGFTTRDDGSGIGLYISRNLMSNIGGRIHVSNSYILGGTLFELEFPVSL